MTCRHYKDGCSLGLYGGRPSPGVCRQCPSYSGPWRGLGDVVRTIVRVLFLGRVDVAQRLAAKVERKATPGKPGLSGGCGCKQRQQAMNRAIPFHRHAN